MANLPKVGEVYVKQGSKCKLIRKVSQVELCKSAGLYVDTHRVWYSTGTGLNQSTELGGWKRWVKDATLQGPAVHVSDMATWPEGPGSQIAQFGGFEFEGKPFNLRQRDRIFPLKDK